MAHREKPAEKLGTLIRPARQRMGWTQEQLADRLGVDKGYISAIETGVRRWPLEHVAALAEVLGLDVVDMAEAAEMLPGYKRTVKTVADEFPPEDPAQKVIEIMRRADYKERRALLVYAKFQEQEYAKEKRTQTKVRIGNTRIRSLRRRTKRPLPNP